MVTTTYARVKGLVCLIATWLLLAVGAAEAKPLLILKGGYPEVEDFERLKQHGVTKIVTLLDPRLPEEDILLRTEEKLARYYGIELVKLPMSSRLSRSTTDEYRSRVAAAVSAIEGDNGVVYFHCYHGVHRTGSVAGNLNDLGYEITDFVVEKRRDEAERVKRAERHYEEGDYTQAIEVLNKLPHLDHRAHSLLGWSQFKAGRLAEAEQTFNRILKRVPETNEARNGVGYIALRGGKLEDAEKAFKLVIESESEDVDANMGMALIRMRQAKYESAERYLNTCVKLAPDNQEAKELLATVNDRLSNN
jgi:tetratricopeptide (TPR) repeat protein